MELKPVFEKIEFVDRYQKICEQHNDFDSSLNDNNYQLYSSLINKFGYKAKFYKNESFYRIEEGINNIALGFQLTLKNGLIETMVDIKFDNDWCTPDSRLDFICEDLDSNFDRDTYNLPKYSSEKELELILKDIFGIYEDLKVALVAHLESA